MRCTRLSQIPKKDSTRAPHRPPANPKSFEKQLVGASDFQFPGFALIFFGTLIAYLPAVRGAMLWDDASHITRSELWSLPGLWRIWFDLGATQQYYPVLHSAFWLEYRIWGDSALGYHLTNVILHAMSACLVVMIVRRLAVPGAWLSGPHLCAASRVRRICRLDFGAKDHIVRRLLSGLSAYVFAF
jgi:hypothetical protein